MRRSPIVSAVAVSLFLAGPLAVAAQKPAAAKSSRIEAHQQMRDALARARTAHKDVLIKFSASWCGPCISFDRFLFDKTGVGAIMQKHFEIVSMTALEMPPKDTLNTPGAVQLSKEVGGNDPGNTGIPYFFMLNSEGKKTGDSNHMPDKSNIGYPETKVEVESFDRLLQETAPSMTPAERARIKTFLDKAAGRS